MINELYPILNGLESVGIPLPRIHDDITVPGKGRTVRILLSPDGCVEKVEAINKESLSDVWVLATTRNVNRFPTIKLRHPLRPSAHQAYKEWRKSVVKPSESELKDKIEELREHYALEPSVAYGTQGNAPKPLKQWPEYRAKIEERKQQLWPLRNSSSSRCVYELYQRFLNSESNGLSILLQLDKKLWQACCANPDTEFLEIAASIFFGDELKRDNTVEAAKRITLLFDFISDEYSGSFATSHSHIQEISDALEQSTQHNKRVGVCSLSLESKVLVSDNFSSRPLLIIGETILFSRFDGEGRKCVLRYGKAGADSYSISIDIVKGLAASLALLAKEENKRYTWDSIPSESAKDSDLLLAYCKNHAGLMLTPLISGKLPEKYAELPNSIDDFEDYQDVCKRVIKAFDGSDMPLAREVSYIILRKVDKGNSKVIFSSTRSRENLESAAKQWAKGCKNASSICLWVKAKDKVILRSPRPVAPKKLIEVSKRKYIRKGTKSVKVPAITFAEMMRLFFDKDESSTSYILRILYKVVKQYLLIFERVALEKRASYDNAAVLDCAALIGLLLFKVGRSQEVYMNDFAFQLGQLFSAVDELHIGYCKDKRAGDIPNTLIGNQSYNMALHNPARALNLLSHRLKPYYVWAKQKEHSLKEGEKKPNAIYASRWLEKISPTLHVHLQESSEQSTDTFNAELMLGYLAGRPIKPKQFENPGAKS